MSKTYMKAVDKNVGCVTLYCYEYAYDDFTLLVPYMDEECTKPVQDGEWLCNAFDRGISVLCHIIDLFSEDELKLTGVLAINGHHISYDDVKAEVLTCNDSARGQTGSIVIANGKVMKPEDLDQRGRSTISYFSGMIKPRTTGGAILHKLYFDGAEIFRSMADFEEYIPMTFDEIYALCYEEENFVYIGDGQMKYYPQLDLKGIPRKPESITFMSTAQLDGKNFHTRIIITADNDVKTDQIVDVPMDKINEIVDARIAAWAAQNGH